MKKFSKKTLFWTPRVLTILFALFISIFAFDVFEENEGFLNISLALFLHLIPTFVIIIILILSWKREWIGGIFYLILAILYIFWANSRLIFPFYLIIATPLILIALLFFLNWKFKDKIKG